MSELRPVKQNGIASQARQALEDYILQNKLAPGTKLPTDRELAENLSCSRTAVREALKSLEAIGLIELKVGRGIFVSDLALSDILERFYPVMFRDIEDEGQALLEARLAVEMGVVGHAAVRMDGEQIESLRAMLKRHGLSTSLQQAADDDVEFHQTLAQACCSPLLAEISVLLKRFFAMDTQRELQACPPELLDDFTRIQVSDNVREHSDILEAIALRDAGLAKERFREHLEAPGPRSRIDDYLPPSQNTTVVT